MNTGSMTRRRKGMDRSYVLTEPAVRMRADVVLGSPRSRCSGVGICRISALGGLEECPCPVYHVEVVRLDAGRIKVMFDRRQISGLVWEKQFKDNRFEVEDYCMVPRDVASMLKLEKRRIRPGRYPVCQSAGHLAVVFTL